jgi:uncharacterized integral membrane protein
MRVLSWLLRLAVFLVLMGFALSNTDTATLRFFGIPEFEWRAPMVLFLLLFFAAGLLLGAMATVPLLFRQRRRIGRLQKDAAVATRPAPEPPLADAVRPPARRDAGGRGL